MVMSYTVVAIALCFVLSAFGLPYWIRRAKDHGLLITDVQKFPKRKIPYLAGFVVAFSAVCGILFYIAAQTFFRIEGDNVIVLLASVSTILIALIIGVVDDLLGEKIGLRQSHKPLFTILAALPLVVVNAGANIMYLPWLGHVTLGHFYTFVVVPVGVVGAANGFNMLAGVNGLEAGMGLIILSTLGYITYFSGGLAASVIALCMVAALIPLFWLNKFPAKILPGNGLTYAVGAAVGVVAIVGDAERSAVLLFIPYFIELVLKARGRFKKESLAKALPDGSLVNRYDNWYSLNHVVISFLRGVKKKAFEWEVVACLLAFELFVAFFTLVVFWVY